MKKKILGIVFMFVVVTLINFGIVNAVEPGGSGSVSVTISNSEKFGSLDGSVSIDSALTVTSVEASSGSATYNNGKVSWTSGGTVVSSVALKFNTTVSSAATSGGKTIKVSASLYDDEINDIGTVSSSGSISVTVPNSSSSTATNNPSSSSTSTVTKSSDATLKSLSVSPTGMTPSFSKNTTSYKMTVNSDVNSVSVSASTNSSKAKYSVSGNKNLVDGTNLVKVIVTAEDGTTKTYKISVVKKVTEENGDIPNVIEESAVEEENMELEEEALGNLYLSTLVITGIEISPVFSSGIYEYTANIINDSSVEVIALANQEQAKVEIMGNQNLIEGNNLIVIVLTSADGSETVTYQITVNKTIDTTVLKTDNVISIGNLKIYPDRINWPQIIVIVVAGVILILLALYAWEDYKKINNKDRNKIVFPEEATKDEKNVNAIQKEQVDKNSKGRRFK